MRCSLLSLPCPALAPSLSPRSLCVSRRPCPDAHNPYHTPPHAIAPALARSVTRTLHFGEPTAFEKRAYTRVLQGHIAIDAAVFPDTTTGYMLDPWARRALWQDGLGAFFFAPGLPRSFSLGARC